MDMELNATINGIIKRIEALEAPVIAIGICFTCGNALCKSHGNRDGGCPRWVNTPPQDEPFDMIPPFPKDETDEPKACRNCGKNTDGRCGLQICSDYSAWEPQAEPIKTEEQDGWTKTSCSTCKHEPLICKTCHEDYEEWEPIPPEQRKTLNALYALGWRWIYQHIVYHKFNPKSHEIGVPLNHIIYKSEPFESVLHLGETEPFEIRGDA